MNLTPKILGLALVALVAATPAAAQDTKSSFHVGLNGTYAMDGLHNITNNYTGYSAEVGYTGHLANTTVPFRTTLSFEKFAGKVEDGFEQSLTGVQLAGDLIIHTGAAHLDIITGISINKWDLKTNPTPEPLVPGVPDKDPAKGTKFGARLGLELNFNDHWAGSFMIQATELGTTRNANSGVNPSWYQFGIKYHF